MNQKTAVGHRKRIIHITDCGVSETDQGRINDG